MENNNCYSAKEIDDMQAGGEAREEIVAKVAQLWCKPELEHLTMIPELAYAIVALVESETQSLQTERDGLVERVSTLFDAIKHGDKNHQDWLKKAIRNHFKN